MHDNTFLDRKKPLKVPFPFPPLKNNPKFKCCPVIGQIQIWIDFLIAILCVKWAVG